MHPARSFLPRINATLGALALLAATLCSLPAPARANDGDSPVARIEGGTVHFTGYAKPARTELHDLKYLGVIKPEEGEPYFLFSARNCQGCSNESFLHAIRPSQGKVASFVYPGRVLLPKNRELVLDSRAFYGKCVPGMAESYVVHQREKIGKRNPRMMSSVYVAEAGPLLLREKLYERGGPKLATTLKQVKAKLCREIDGRNRVAEVHPLDGRYKGMDPAADTSDDDDDEPEAGAKPEAEAPAPAGG